MRQLATGLRAWVLQRISAMYLLVFFVYLLTVFIFTPPADYAQWRAFVAQPVVSIAILLFYISLLLHAWVGIRDVLIDYVQATVIRFTALLGFGLLFMASGLWAFMAVVRVQLGGG
jgi:succinate dehydrogenase / fumarate reductase membrane anchor subunit